MGRMAVRWRRMKIPDTARLLLAIFAMAGLSGCVALLIHAGKRAYLASRKPAAALPAARAPAAAEQALQDAIRHGAPGLTAIVMRDGRLVFREDLGGIDPAA